MLLDSFEVGDLEGFLDPFSHLSDRWRGDRCVNLTWPPVRAWLRGAPCLDVVRRRRGGHWGLQDADTEPDLSRSADRKGRRRGFRGQSRVGDVVEFSEFFCDFGRCDTVLHGPNWPPRGGLGSLMGFPTSGSNRKNKGQRVYIHMVLEGSVKVPYDAAIRCT